MDATYEIFKNDPQGPLWIEGVTGLQEATKRLSSLSEKNPGEYFAYDIRESRIVARVGFESELDRSADGRCDRQRLGPRTKKGRHAPGSTTLRATALLVVIGLTNPFSSLAMQNASAQNGSASQDGADTAAGQNDNAPIPQVAGHVSSPDDVIGADDSISISCLESEEISKTWRINSTGDVGLPLVGEIHAGGLTAEQFDQKLTKELKRYIREPHITVFIAEFRSQPVTVTGAVHRPGYFQIEGTKTLLTVLTMAGGLDHPPGATATVVRQMKYGAIPLPGAHPDADGTHSIALLLLKDVSDASTPASNLLIRPNDVIDVSNEERMVYIIGEVLKPGKIELISHDSISTMEVLAIAGGLTKLASPRNTEIMRQNSNGLYERVGSIDLKKVSEGKGEDRILNAGDIIFVPSSNVKAYSQIAAVTAIVTGFAFLTRF